MNEILAIMLTESVPSCMFNFDPNRHAVEYITFNIFMYHINNIVCLSHRNTFMKNKV